MAIAERPTHIPVPEPDLTPDDLVARTAAIRPLLREEAERSEARGYYSERIHDALRRAGLYRVLQPRRFGGYEFDVTTYFRVVIELAKGDPGSGMCFALATGHALTVASYLSEQAQTELFGPDGEFRAPHRSAPGGKARPVEDGLLVSGRWRYCTGIPYATHFMAGTTIEQEPGAEEPPRQLIFLIPRGQYTMLEDWGGGRDLGDQASGTNTVVVDDVFVPTHMTIDASLRRADVPPEGTPGSRLHGNPMYIGRLAALYQGRHGAVQVGTAQAAVAEYERSMVAPERRTGVERYHNMEDKLAFGRAVMLTDKAEAILIRAGELHADYCRAWAERGRPYTLRDEARLHALVIQAGHHAVEAVKIVFDYNGPDSAKRENPLNRYLRDAMMYGLHGPARPDAAAEQITNAYFGLPPTVG
jgi:3-hydroxy-9,10-secoandrosta-1,3,5(10)-triene-9,17-dione monooxygenase